MVSIKKQMCLMRLTYIIVVLLRGSYSNVTLRTLIGHELDGSRRPTVSKTRWEVNAILKALLGCQQLRSVH